MSFTRRTGLTFPRKVGHASITLPLPPSRRSYTNMVDRRGFGCDPFTPFGKMQEERRLPGGWPGGILPPLESGRQAGRRASRQDAGAPHPLGASFRSIATSRSFLPELLHLHGQTELRRPVDRGVEVLERRSVGLRGADPLPTPVTERVERDDGGG